MDFIDIVKYVFTFIMGLGSGSLLTLIFKKNSRTQNGNSVTNGNMVNGSYINGSNNKVNENSGKE